MTMRDFIKFNQAELTTVISNHRDFVPRTASCFCHRNGTDHHHTGDPVTIKDMREWILNDESLYHWARREGVKI